MLKTFSRLLVLTALAVTLLGLNLGAHADESNRAGTINFSNLPIAPLEFADVTPRTIDQADAEKALKAFGIWEPSKYGWSWESRTGENGNYVYTNLRMRPKKGGDLEAMEFLGASISHKAQ